jgi:hypothetical protein
MLMREQVFLAAFLDARRSGRLYRKAVNEGIDKVRTHLGAPMSETEAKRVLATWRRAGKTVVLPKFIDPATARGEAIDERFLNWVNQTFKDDPLVLECISRLARNRKPAIAIVVKLGIAPHFPHANPLRPRLRFGKKARPTT